MGTDRKSLRFRVALLIVLFAAAGTASLLITRASTPMNNSIEPENGKLVGAVTAYTDINASENGYVTFNGTVPQQPPDWTWPATLSNTGPAPGTKFVTMAPREFGPSDSNKTFDGVQINVGQGQEVSITGSNITFKNCKIMYTGTVHSPNGFLFIGKSYDKTVRPKNILFDHCIIDAGDRHEYNVRAYYGQFDIQYSQLRGGSHNIDSGGDLDAGTTINIYRNYIYDYSNNPYALGYDFNNRLTWGHAAGIYFTGNNGTVNIEDNTIIGNRWQQCNSGWSNGPGPGCYEIDGTGSVVVYAGEDSNPDKSYIVKHNQISGGSYAPIRFYGESPGIQSIQILNNTYTAQSGWPTFSIEGGIYTFDGSASNHTLSGNSWGLDTVCSKTASSCKGSPNIDHDVN